MKTITVNKAEFIVYRGDEVAVTGHLPTKFYFGTKNLLKLNDFLNNPSDTEAEAENKARLQEARMRDIWGQDFYEKGFRRRFFGRKYLKGDYP